MKITNNKKEIEKAMEFKKEVKRLKSLFKDMDKNILKAAAEIIDNAAFMAITLRELRDHLNEHGLITEYQNGENQFGTKKSPEVEIYNTMVKNFLSSMKQLSDLLPKGKGIDDDGFNDFLQRK